MDKGKHYQACCMNKECSIHGTCASSIPHAIEDTCYVKCPGIGGSTTTCSLIVTENDKITVVKSLGG